MKLCLFRIGDAVCGVETARVTEILADVEIAPVPGASTHVSGAIILRGRLLAAVNCAPLLSPGSECTQAMVLDVSARQVALRIDEVLDVLHDSDVLAPVPLSVPGDAARILHGIIDTGTNIVHVIDVEKLVEA